MLPLNTLEQMAVAEDIGANAGLSDDPKDAFQLMKEHNVDLETL